MHYIFVVLVLFFLLLIYFKIADKYNIIDKPNYRSAHTNITLRGGGIIFPLAFLVFLGKTFFNGSNVASLQSYIIFGTGLLTISAISFIDDILDLSTKIRLVFHFLSVTLLLYFVQVFQLLPIWVIPILYVIIIGILNAYNFMDGINGMTGLYSITVLGSLLYINQNLVIFTEDNYIIYPILACIVFLFFNFRKKAKCFMGDVGSMAIAFWVIALLGLLMMKTQNLKWVLFLTIYGVEVILTIIERLKLKENIFKAHRRHLYQLLANEKQIDHRLVSLAYALLQLIINLFVIKTSSFGILSYLILMIPTIFVYLFFKLNIQKNIQNYF